MTTYTFVAETSSGQTIREQAVQAESEKDARRAFWQVLSDGERNQVASIECVDEA